MKYNEALKREIPIIWIDTSLAQIVSRFGTGLNPRKNFLLGEGNNYYITIKNVLDGKLILDEKCDKVSDKALQLIDRRSDLQKGDILYTSIDPVGRAYLVQEKPSNWNINESVFTIRPNYKLVTSEFLYHTLTSKDCRAYAKLVSTGSVQQ